MHILQHSQLHTPSRHQKHPTITSNKALFTTDTLRVVSAGYILITSHRDMCDILCPMVFKIDQPTMLAIIIISLTYRRMSDHNQLSHYPAERKWPRLPSGLQRSCVSYTNRDPVAACKFMTLNLSLKFVLCYQNVFSEIQYNILL